MPVHGGNVYFDVCILYDSDDSFWDWVRQAIV